ncbi:hypothetical protein PIB30_010422 [Stylosanthes scabra]|uniref:Uncharacterized protein n=1 Tax=Stylosanthes scabra TaxID=79078 RepID=A0ABU6X3R1_9FABA|nr:hypothetical protein [Stylosanthes scabra]
MLRQLSKLEPVPEKSDKYRSYGELTRSVIIANPTNPELALDNHRSYFPGGPFFPAPIVNDLSSYQYIYGGSLLILKTKPRLVAGTLAGGPPAATVSRDVSSYPTWKQEPHRHLLLPMLRCRHKPSR